MAASALRNLILFTMAMFTLPFGAYFGVYTLALGASQRPSACACAAPTALLGVTPQAGPSTPLTACVAHPSPPHLHRQTSTACR